MFSPHPHRVTEEPFNPLVSAIRSFTEELRLSRSIESRDFPVDFRRVELIALYTLDSHAK